MTEYIIGRKRISFLLRVTPKTVSRYVSRGLLKAERFGKTTPLRVSRCELDRLHREIHGTDLGDGA